MNIDKMVARGQHQVFRPATGLDKKTTHGGRGTLCDIIIQTEDYDILKTLYRTSEKHCAMKVSKKVSYSQFFYWEN